MTDIFCSKCGEPWDMYELHDVTRPRPISAKGNYHVALTFTEAAKQFSQFGCGTFTTGNPEPCTKIAAS